MTLEKAKLLDAEHLNSSNHSNHIEFMFNPAELSFSRSISIEQSEGSRNRSGGNKSSFKHPNPYSLKINNLILDTYEDQTSVLTHVEKFARAVRFLEEGNEEGKRPPIYVFTWGANSYLRCFVKTFSFNLTLFLSDGTPVRATVTLDLEQVDDPNPEASQTIPKVTAAMRSAFGRESFL